MTHKNFVIRKIYSAESGEIQASVVAYDIEQAERYLAEKYPDQKFKIDFVKVCDSLMARRGITVNHN